MTPIQMPSAASFFRKLEQVKEITQVDPYLIEELLPPPFLCQAKGQKQIIPITTDNPISIVINKLAKLQLPAIIALKEEYQNYVQYICNPQNKFFDDQEYELFNLLKSDPEGYYNVLLEKSVDPSDQILYLKRLGNLYLKKKSVFKAANLYNSALAIAKKMSDKSIVDHLFEKLEQMESALLLEWGIKKTIEHKNYLKTQHEYLDALRTKIADMLIKSESIDKIQKHLTEGLQSILSALISQAQFALGSIPCQYAFVGFGSMSRGEMCPYSDIEFGILIEETKPEYLAYFRKLAKLLELKILNLSETEWKVIRPKKVDGKEIPAQSFTPKGFSMDIGGVSPCGVEDVYELIGTPQQLSQFQTEEWVQKNAGVVDVLVNALSQSCFIVGQKELFDLYCIQVKSILKQPLREKRSLQYLKGHLSEFAPLLDERRLKLRAFDIKRDLYRPLHMIIGSLTQFYGLTTTNTLASIQALMDKDILHKQGGEILKSTLQDILRLRLRAHLFYHTEKEILYHAKEGDDLESKELFILKAEETEKLRNIYNVLFQLHEAASAFAKDGVPLATTNFQRQNIKKRTERKTDVHGEAHEIGLEQTKIQFLQRAALQPDSTDHLGDLGGIKIILGEQDASEYLLERYNQLNRKHGENPHFEVALSLQDLGVASNKAGDPYQAIIYYAQALEMYKKLFGEKFHPEIAKVLNNMGCANRELEKIEQARINHEEALEIRRILFGDIPHREIADSINCLGALKLLENNFPDALMYFSQALEMRQTVYGEWPHPDLATSLNNMGCVHNSLGNLQAAETYFTQALVMEKSLFKNKNHPSLVKTFINLGTVLYNRKKTQQANECFENAVQINRELNEKIVLPELRICLFHLAVTANNPRKAQSLYLEYFDGIDLDQPDERTATVLNNLGQNYFNQDDLEKAHHYLVASLKMRRIIYHKAPDSLLVSSLVNVGSCLKHQNQLQEALRHYLEALKIAEILDDSKPNIDLASSLNHLGAIYALLKQPEEALKHYLRCLEVERLLHNSETIAIALGNVSASYRNLKDHARSKECLVEAVLLQKHVFNNQPHEDLAVTLNNLAMDLEKLGDYESAIHYFKECLEMRKKLNSPQTEIADLLLYLGTAYYHTGEFELALDCHIQCLKLRKTIYGNTPHFKMTNIYRKIGSDYEELKNYKKAAENYSEALRIGNQTENFTPDAIQTDLDRVTQMADDEKCLLS